MTENDLTDLYNKRAEQLATRHKRGAASTSLAVRVLVFTVGKETYGVELTDLAETMAYRGCTPVPNSSTTLLGVINVRGEIRPLFDAARLFDVEHEPTNAGFIVMVRSTDNVFGLKVDRIEQVRDLQPNEASLTKQGNIEWNARHLKGVTQDTLRLIDVASLSHQLVPSLKDDHKQEQMEWKAKRGITATAGSS